MSNEISVNGQFAPDINIQQRESFLKTLNEKPERTEKQAGMDGIPISFLETLLDEVYLGLWNTKNFRYQVITNEIVGTIDLEVFDPSVKIWISRSGSAAVQIQQDANSLITDIAAKKKNALQKDFPKLETMCLKAACKRLGKKFGRDLNRKVEDTYNEEYTPTIELNEVIDSLKAKMEQCTTREALVELWQQNEALHGNKAAGKLFKSYQMKINLNNGTAASSAAA